MLTKVRVKYADGREVVVIASPKAQVETERHFKGVADTNKIEASYYLSWAALHFAGREPAAFDAWLDLIEEAEEVDPDEADEQAEDPTKTGQSTTGSSD